MGRRTPRCTGATVQDTPATGTLVNRRKGDLNGDGKPDLLWQNVTDGSLVVWFMDGLTRTAYTYINPMTPDAGWTVVGMADFDGDGYQDLLLQHTSGAVQMWTLHDTQRVRVLTPSVAITDPGWHVQAVGDFNADGLWDIAFQHYTSDAVLLWFIGTCDATTCAVTSVTPTIPLMDADLWRIAAPAELNWTANWDLVWEHQATGSLVGWLLTGGTVDGTPVLTPDHLADLNWRIAAAADYSGDGTPDLVFHHQTDNWVLVWTMSGTTRVGYAYTNPPQVTASVWRLVGPR